MVTRVMSSHHNSIAAQSGAAPLDGSSQLAQENVLAEPSGIVAAGLQEGSPDVFLPGNPARLKEPYLGCGRRPDVRIDCAQGRAVREGLEIRRWRDHVQAGAIGLKKWLEREFILNHSLVAKVVAQGQTSAVVREQNRAWRNLLVHKLDGFFHELLSLVAGLNVGAGRALKHTADDQDQRENQDKFLSPPLVTRPARETYRNS